MKRLAAAVAAALVLPGAALADPPPAGVVHVKVPPGTSQLEWGYELYAGNCSSCHGQNGEGILSPQPAHGAGDITGEGPSLRGVGALAADFYLRTGYMPLARANLQPWRSPVLFSDAEIRALVAYVASLGKGPAIPTPQPERGNVAVGLQLFTDHCAGCHQVVARGGIATGARIPPLTRANARQIAQAVRVGPYVMPRFSKQQISDAQLNSLVAYVLYAQHPYDRGGWALGNLGPVPEGIVAWLLAGTVLVATCVLIGTRLRE